MQIKSEDAHEKKKRPLLLTLIVAYFIFSALPGLTSTIVMLSPSWEETNPELYAQVHSLSAIQRYSPLALSVLLIISMVLLFLQKRSSLIVFSIYLGLELIVVISKALSQNWIAIYGIKGLVTSLGSFLIGAIVLGYMFWLRKENILY